MLLKQGQIARLRRKFGPKPDEGQVFIQTQTRVEDGVGYKTVIEWLGPIPARISFDPENRSAERVIAGQPTSQHRYLVELPFETEVWETQQLMWAGVPWLPSKSYLAGHRVVPSNANGKVYRAENTGVTASLEPDWTDITGDYNSDGTINWICVGDYSKLSVIEIAQYESYAITKDVYCDFRS